MTESNGGKASRVKAGLKSLGEGMGRHKKMIKVLLILVVLGFVACGAFHAMYTTSGVVTAVDGDAVTITNFWGSTVVTIGEPWKSASAITVGERIEVMKNIRGDIIGVRAGDRFGHDRDRGQDRRFNGEGKDRVKGHDQGQRMDRGTDEGQCFEGQMPGMMHEQWKMNQERNDGTVKPDNQANDQGTAPNQGQTPPSQAPATTMPVQ